MYLDPGFGGMLVQALVATIAAGGAILFILRRKIRALFKRKQDDVTPIERSQADVDGDVVDTLADDEDKK